MFEDLCYSLIAAALALVVLGSTRSLPRWPNGRPAIVASGGALLLIAWAGGVWLGSVFPSALPALPFLFVAILGAFAFAIPIRPRGPGSLPGRRATILGPRTIVPGRLYWALMVAIAAAVVARYWADALV